MFGGYTEVAAYYVNTPWPEAGDEEAEEDAGPLPSDYVPLFQAADPWFKTSACPKDFILIAEFSEMEGPKPLITIPKDAGGAFDLNDFSVRIMSVDYQTMASGFSVVEDTQVVLSENQNGVYSYVHHFTLYDSSARGFVRPFCMAYVTPDHSKLISFFEEMSTEFAQVSHSFKYGNLMLFVKDMTHYLSDLHYTRERFLERKTELDREEGGNLVHLGPDPDEEIVLQSVTLQGVNSLIQEVKDIVETTSSLLNDGSLEERFQQLESKSRDEAQEEPLEALDVENFQYSCSLHTNSPRLTRDYMQSRRRAGSTADLECSWTEEKDIYKPRVVRTSNKKRFDNSLRTLHELCQWGAKEGLNRLRSLHKYFSRDMCTLLIERNDTDVIDPPSSLLTIGRNVEVNYLTGLNIARMSGSPTEGRSESHMATSDSFATLHRHWLSSDTLASFHSAESFLSCQEDLPPPPTTRGSYQPQIVLGSAFVEERSHSASSPAISCPVPNNEVGSLLTDDASASCTSECDVERISCGSVISTTGSTGDSLPENLISMRSSDLSAHSDSLNGDMNQPIRVSVVSAADHVFSFTSTSTGFSVLKLVNQYPFTVHALYSLLSGRPVVVFGTAKQEKEVRALVNTLAVFVPGHAGPRHAVIPWHTKPLRLTDLAGFKLVGLCRTEKRKLEHMVPSSVKRYITIFDIEKKLLWAPTYQGGVLTDIYNKRKSFTAEKAYMAYIHSVVYELAMKSSVYYHLTCLGRQEAASRSDTGVLAQRQRFDHLASQCLGNLKVNIQDAKMIQYFAEIIKLQQLNDIYCLSPRSGDDGISEFFVGTARLDHSKCSWFKVH